MASISPILKTKLYRPPITDDLVQRTDLLQRLNEYRDLPLTLVSAPAGYGKSLAISQWIENTGIGSAWISLDKEHNNLRRFLQYLVESIRISYPNALSTMYDYLQGVDLPPVSVLAYELINRLDEIQDEFVIVLDDFYRINEMEVHQLLNILLSYPPQNVQLVIISRMDPPLNINQLRAYGRIHEIRVEQLQFTESDIGSLYGKLTNSELNPETIKHLMEQTEGWVVGLRLAHLYAYNTKDVDKALMDLSGNYRLISKFLLEEVLSKQPDTIREMLLFSAVPDRFCAELLDAIYLPTSKNKLSGEEFIQHIYKNNLFIIPLDQEQKWVRYHHLFRELLLGELKNSIQDVQINEIHIRVSGWMESEGFIGDALNYAINGSQVNLAANILLKNRYDWMQMQKWWDLEELLAKFPENFINQSAGLLLLKAWIEGANKFKMDQVFPITQLAMEAFDQHQDDLSDEEVKTFHGEVATLRAMPFFWMGEGALCHEHAVIAIQNTPESHLAVFGQAMEYYSGSFHLMGDSEKGTKNIRSILDKNDASIKTHLHRYYITLISIEILNGNISTYQKYNTRYARWYKESMGW